MGGRALPPTTPAGGAVARPARRAIVRAFGSGGVASWAGAEAEAKAEAEAEARAELQLELELEFWSWSWS